jgi:hypothetical protein
MCIIQSVANDLYTMGNNRGLGYAPYADEAVDDSVEAAIKAAEADGWEAVLVPSNTSDVTVLRDGDNALMAIGGDGVGNNAWAVIIAEGT